MNAGEETLPRLQDLHCSIDHAYKDIADSLGFTCKDCDGVKCCTVDLNLHTHVEMMLLRCGFQSLDSQTQKEVLARARAVVEAKRINPYGDDYRNAVCALNSRGLCILYEYRPMICRLAGIPHQITRPDGKIMLSGGCTRYKIRIEPDFPDVRLDRTAFYRQMATIEINVIRCKGHRAETKTISEVICMEDAQADCMDVINW